MGSVSVDIIEILEFDLNSTIQTVEVGSSVGMISSPDLSSVSAQSSGLDSSAESTTSSNESRALSFGSPIPSAQSPSLKPTIRRRAFSTGEKLEILQKYDETKSIRAVSRETGVSRRHIQLWIELRSQLEQTDDSRCRVGGGGRKLISFELEEQLLGIIFYYIQHKNKQ